MPFIKSIASRIFGLAVTLVCLMIALAGFLLWQVTSLNAELHAIAGYYAPLEQCLSELNEAGLRKRIAFERQYGALLAPADREEALKESTENFTKYSGKVRDELKRAMTFLNEPPAGSERPELLQMKDLVEHVAESHGIVTERQKEVLDLVRAGQPERAADILRVLDDLQRILQNQRSELESMMGQVMEHSTTEASRRHLQVVWTTIIATITSVLLGLSFAALVTKRLVQPVRSLMSGLQTVEKGDLSVQLPVSTADEIGRLTKSFNFFIGELRVKEELRSTFGKYIDPRILERVLLENAETASGRQDMTVSFSDLLGFTAIGEHLTPAGGVNLLNRHFTLQAQAIQQHHGVVDKFMGDAVMAFWGAPFTRDEERSLEACRAALDQARAVAHLQSILPEVTGLRKNLPQLGIRIGISTGDVVAGNIGSENTRAYTVIGDSVNLAARLEHANRFYGTKILLCGTTRREVANAVIAREIDTIVVKGKTETTCIYELLAMAGDEDEMTRALCAKSEIALAAYRTREWDAAERAFRECLALNPDDQPALLFLERIAAFRVEPPGPQWQGEWVFQVK